jgi:uncharacterized protein
MRKWSVFFAGAALSAVGLVAQTPGFDCSKAATASEKAICASPELREADSKMTAAYRALLKAAPADAQAGIRREQSEWLRDRDAQCKDDPAGLTGCLLGAENDRTEALQRAFERHNGVSFLSSSISLTAPDSPDTAKERQDADQPAYGTLNASWPQAVSSTPEWMAWNKAIAKAVLKTAQPDPNKPATQWQKSWARDTDTQISVDFNAVTDSLVTVSITLSWLGHTAAHPDQATVQLNWLLKERRAIQAADVFRPQSNWLQQLYNRTYEYLYSQRDEQDGDDDQESKQEWTQDWKPTGDAATTLRGILADPANWQMDDKGITIVFDPHAPICHACTWDPFTMSWESLKPLLNPAFPVPTQ